jgi:hypothetical protein
MVVYLARRIKPVQWHRQHVIQATLSYLPTLRLTILAFPFAQLQTNR